MVDQRAHDLPRVLAFVDDLVYEIQAGHPIAADDGIKPQTSEALEAINSAGIPFVVALNKIDKSGANLEKVKKDLSEKNVLIEEWGGKIPLVPISAKTGEGIGDLLEVVILVSDLEELKADPQAMASGVIIESHLDSKRGNAATLIIQNGVLRQGQFIASGGVTAPVRIFEDFAGHKIKEASPGQPARVVGFNFLPEVGSTFETFFSKKEAEEAASKFKAKEPSPAAQAPDKGGKIFEIPIIIKADMAGSAEAVEGEIKKLESEKLKIKILRSRTGAVSEDDVKFASGSANSIIVGFKVGIENTALHLAERFSVRIKVFEVVYDVIDWLKDEIKKILPEEIAEKELGRAKIIRIFKQGVKDQIIGGRVLKGMVVGGKRFRIKRRGNVLGEGKIQELEQAKQRVAQVEEGKEFGARVSAKIALAEGDEMEIIEEEKIKPEI
ncbi:MAG: hypothetical protein HYW09_01200 [Candidatus Niyogibacteria bacterium]|nr:hypothetical protein [Candidatus Niyogibacteria bacterium]